VTAGVVRAVNALKWLAIQKNCWYFLINFVITKNEDADDDQDALQRWPDKDYLKILLDYCLRDKRIIVPKSRQIMISWFFCVFFLWMAIAKREKAYFIQARNLDQAVHLITRIQGVYKRLPQWIKDKCPITRSVTDELEFANGSRIVGIPAGVDQTRGYTVSAILLDEFAIHDFAEGTLSSAISSVGRYGKIFIVSSVKMSFMYQLVHDIKKRADSVISGAVTMAQVLRKGMVTWKNPGNKYRVIETKYLADPAKDPATEEGLVWYTNEREKVHSDQLWEQDYECNWSAGDGKRFFDTFAREKHVRELQYNKYLPVVRGWDWGYHHPATVFCQIDESHTVNGIPRIYVLRERMGTDTSLGRYAINQALPVFLNQNVSWIDCGDSAGKQCNDKSERTSIEELTDLKDDKGNPYVKRILTTKKGIKVGTDMMRRAIEAGQLIVDPSCKLLIDGFCGGYTFKPWRVGMQKSESELPSESEYCHLMDALRYIFVNCVKIKKVERIETNKKHSRVYGPGNRRAA
jgi:hypothetical protein